MKPIRILSPKLSSLLALPLLVLGCSSDVAETPANGGSSGLGGAGGSAGGVGGTASGGTGGTSNLAGTGGTGGSAGGSAGSAGSGGGGSGGVGGGAGNAGTSGGGSGGGGGAGGSSGGAGGGGAFTLTTPAFETNAGCSPDDKQACDTIPTEHTNYGQGDMKHVSPELNWSNPPAGTQSFAVVFQDLSNTFAHWVIWNIPGSATGLAENVPGGAMPSTPEGASQVSIDNTGHYFGPGAPCNVYEFVVYALNQATISPPDATDRTAVRAHIQGLGAAILGQASVRARSDEGACN